MHNPRHLWQTRVVARPKYHGAGCIGLTDVFSARAANALPLDVHPPRPFSTSVGNSFFFEWVMGLMASVFAFVFREHGIYIHRPCFFRVTASFSSSFNLYLRHCCIRKFAKNPGQRGWRSVYLGKGGSTRRRVTSHPPGEKCQVSGTLG